MSQKIFEKDGLYTICRQITDFFIRHSYRRLQYEGLDKIPTDGPIIYAPNHCNALMDPLAALALNRKRKVFVARADIFSKPAIVKILTFFKIMPINRLRDGLRNMTRAEETIEKSIEVLTHRVDFCIMAEGTHRPMHSLLPIGKGVARVAYGAYQQLGPDTPLYIVPLGLDYGDYYRFRTTQLVKVGDPINVTGFFNEHKGENEHDLMEKIRNMVSEGIKGQIVYIPDNEDYEAIWESSKLASGCISPMDLKGRFDANRAAIARIEKFRTSNGVASDALFERVLSFTGRRRKAGISLNSLRLAAPALRALLCTLLAIVTLPLFLFAAICSLPIWLGSELVIRNIRDRAFHNSFRCAIMTLIWPIFLLIWAIVLFCTVRWWMALVLLALLLLAPAAVYDYVELLRMARSHWSCAFNRSIRKDYADLKETINKI